ncbi:MAG: TIGR00730 family Rossman fold protein [Cyclobacteriaceae bacterium]|nr:TIGR00730 family Rossman fold protein [Cyclobacteriaceae bacterium HetDA_MAG_MS6]
MNQKFRYLTVFCGSSPGTDPSFKSSCHELANVLTSQNIGLVYGGGKVGLMGVLADAVLKLGGEVIGVIPQKLLDWEVGHRGITKLHVVDTMHERKALMADLSDGFIALPGGIGTLEEIIEVFTWLQLGYHHKPCAFLDVNGYFKNLFHFFDDMLRHEFLKSKNRDSLIVASKAPALLEKMRAFSIE